MANFAVGGGTVIIKTQGFKAVADHFLTAGIIINPVTISIVGAAASEIARVARPIELPHFLTGATFFSISAGDRGSGMAQVHVGAGEVYAEVGTVASGNLEQSPAPQDRLLEFGFVHAGSGQFIQYPFMIPAALIVAPMFEQAMFQMAQIIANKRSTASAPLIIGSPAGPTLQAARSRLYSSAKFLGDANVFIKSPLIGSLRSWEYAMARGLGDIDSAMRGAIGTRISMRVVGRFTGAGMSVTRSAILSGPSSSFAASSQRIYNRFAGHEVGAGLRGAL